MSDSILLQIGGQRIQNFLRYTIEADIYTADDAFSLELANPELTPAAGQRCELHVNGILEVTGIIDRVQKSYTKASRSLKVEGRDLTGLLVDSYCEEFIDVQGMTVKALAERLIRKVPYIQRKDVVYQDNIRGNLKKKKGRNAAIAAFDVAQSFAKIEPGQTIFEVLRTYAMSRGMMFFSLPDGTFVFGKPKDGGEPPYRLVMRKTNPRGNNVLEGTLMDDVSKRYSKITMVGQQQGLDIIDAASVSTKAVVTDSTFPFYKPYVATDQNDSRSPKLHAQMLMERMKYEGFRLEYKVPGHSQGGINWRINEMCRVTDEVLGLDGDYLIYGRTFELSKEQGVITTLKLGLPGMVQ
jgi:prophage tail gpP-like protein